MYDVARTEECVSVHVYNIKGCKYKSYSFLYLYLALNKVTQLSNQHMHTFNFY